MKGILRSVLRPSRMITKRLYSAYDSDGKTTATVLNNEPGRNVMIDSYSERGFILNNGMQIIGPSAIFSKTVFSWNVECDDDIHEESLKLFTMLDPKLDLLVIGFSGKPDDKMTIMHRLLPFHRKQKLSVEILPTDKAVATFNFLQSEGRFVAAALIPPLKIKLTESEMMGNKLHHQFLDD